MLQRPRTELRAARTEPKTPSSALASCAPAKRALPTRRLASRRQALLRVLSLPAHTPRLALKQVLLCVGARGRWSQLRGSGRERA
eukprot:3351129-Rhodomonas_salina.1